MTSLFLFFIYFFYSFDFCRLQSDVSDNHFVCIVFNVQIKCCKNSTLIIAKCSSGEDPLEVPSTCSRTRKCPSGYRCEDGRCCPANCKSLKRL